MCAVLGWFKWKQNHSGKRNFVNWSRPSSNKVLNLKKYDDDDGGGGDDDDDDFNDDDDDNNDK
jgi:hypothetical protein